MDLVEWLPFNVIDLNSLRKIGIFTVSHANVGLSSHTHHSNTLSLILFQSGLSPYVPDSSILFFSVFSLSTKDTNNGASNHTWDLLLDHAPMSPSAF
jgi:hypothetical protein